MNSNFTLLPPIYDVFLIAYAIVWLGGAVAVGVAEHRTSHDKWAAIGWAILALILPAIVPLVWLIVRRIPPAR